MRDHRITMTNFRSCSTCRSHSQAPLYHYALRSITDGTEGTFVSLRYFLGGDRPSQTTRLTLSLDRINCPRLGLKHNQGGISHCDSTEADAPASKSPTYSTQIMLKPNARL